MNIHTLSGVRTRDPSKRAAAEPRCHALESAAIGVSLFHFAFLMYAYSPVHVLYKSHNAHTHKHDAFGLHSIRKFREPILWIFREPVTFNYDVLFRTLSKSAVKMSLYTTALDPNVQIPPVRTLRIIILSPDPLLTTTFITGVSSSWARTQTDAQHLSYQRPTASIYSTAKQPLHVVLPSRM
jgi:hypothetical protein